MTSLTVLYDVGCPVCCRARRWLKEQRQFVPLRFAAAGSDFAKKLFPELDVSETLDDLTVVGSDRTVYRGEKAWLMCLWALEEYRAWAQRLATPALYPVARKMVQAISAGRKFFVRTK